MTISSSLNASVAGLNVNASKLATISDNIANAGTYGYKRADADFSALVVSSGNGGYTAGGVTATATREISAQGSIVSTEQALDLAVVGRGMLPVTPAASLNLSNPELRLKPTDSFSPDQNGTLVSASGFALLGWPLDNSGNVITQLRDSTTGMEPISVASSQFVASPTTEMDLGVNLSAEDTRAGASGDTLSVPIEYFDNFGSSQTLTATFTPTVPATGASNEWTLSFDDSATAAASNPIATYTLTFDSARGSGGSLLSVATVTGNAYVPADGTVQLDVDGGPIDVTFGPLGPGSSLTQLSAEFAPSSIRKNGNRAGILTSLEFDPDGYLNAIYDTGFTRRIYQVPIVDVPNFDGLAVQDGQTFTVTPQSGPFYLWDSGSGPAGILTGFALEQSTTDIAGELTSLIETQRAYSSNAKVVQTVDEMLQETTNIKR
ncbi:flagellar hook protein FlgE [Albimonas donghaensis]|uniref:Flagellar hook protein FlgE n=1 Tax=Albimonas donghaensis TaxID=356660 RepID=A0A1H2X907_9RHOB|nr:flagellar hook-basal body complex protein [Albimonas donghaensis]MAS44491.1 flagellar biosynthesis protein FlgE [Paracoccaceae bacterium]MBR27489.1 flagellar biosynthesis protein FlgE [Paracoccaceae bacterium]SDW89238.1 flagellar hook protein FlgE [Albimonas donghaensis]